MTLPEATFEFECRKCGFKTDVPDSVLMGDAAGFRAATAHECVSGPGLELDGRINDR